MLTFAAGASLAQRWLLLVVQQQVAGTRSDTVMMKLVEEPRGWFDTVSGVASILISIALLSLCVGLIPAAWNFRKSYKKVNELLDKVYGDINPLMRHASTIADNVNYISTSLRVDVQQVNQTIATANERLQEAVRLTERRVSEFNALLHVVQREAEDTFVSTAATLRGVREGAATFREDALSGSRALRRARLLEEAMERAEALALEDEGEAVVEELEELAELDELDELDESDADLADELEDAAREMEREVARQDRYEVDDDDALDDDAPQSGELSDGYDRGRPPAGSGGGGGERPRIRSRRGRRGAPRRDAPDEQS